LKRAGQIIKECEIFKTDNRLTRDELLESPDYLFTKYQNEIFRQLHGYMRDNQLTQKDVAKKLGVSNAYISQVLNGNFNFTLKKLIELGLVIGKVPKIEFVDKDEFAASKKKVHPDYTRISKKAADKISEIGLVNFPA